MSLWEPHLASKALYGLYFNFTPMNEHTLAIQSGLWGCFIIKKVSVAHKHIHKPLKVVQYFNIYMRLLHYANFYAMLHTPWLRSNTLKCYLKTFSTVNNMINTTYSLLNRINSIKNLTWCTLALVYSFNFNILNYINHWYTTTKVTFRSYSTVLSQSFHRGI